MKNAEAIDKLLSPPKQPQKKKKKRMRLPPGMGSVHHINDGKNRRKPYRARVPSHVDLNVETGKATQKYITIGYYETEIEAIEALMEYRKNPYTLEAASATFSDVFELWKARKYPEISKSGRASYDASYKNSEKLHNMRMKDIRAAHMDEIMQNIPYGFQVQTKLKTFWGQIFKYAMENDIIQKNYAEFIKTRDKDEGTKRTAIPAEDRGKIWAAADAGNTDAEIALIYLYTGMRPSELLEIRKENVDLDSRIMIGGMKTEAGKDRHIPIHKDILPFISRLMQTEGEYLIMRYDKGKPQPMTYMRFNVYHWKPLMENLKMEEYTPHYGRHTCATMLREAGVPDDIRKLILGHASGDITDRYTHIPNTMLIEAIDKIPSRG